MSDRTPDNPGGVKRWLFWAAAGALLVGGLAFVADGPNAGDARLLPLVLALLGESALVLVWLAAAAGLGTTVSVVLFGRHRPAPAIQLALGVAVLILIVWAVGWGGGLNTWSAWLINGLGWALWVFQLRYRLAWPQAPSGPTLLAMPAVGLLVGAATVAPGVLWKLYWKPSQELMAYDVLSYHLQLPKEWMAAGAIRGLEHNVYSYLPSGFEAAFLHIGWMRGGVVDAGLACQLLHAAMALLAAAVIATVVREALTGAANRAKPKDPLGGGNGAPGAAPHRRKGRVAGAAAGAVYLATPWVIATGSIAFNEQAMIALGVAGLAVALADPEMPAGPRGLAAGLLCGVAALCKLTAVGVFVLPVALVLLWRGRAGALPRIGALVAFGLGLAVTLGPFALRNFVWTGNPLFPMATGWLGTGHWTAEQAARWQAAHMPDAGWGQRFERFWEAVLAVRWYGYVVLPVGAVGWLAAIGSRPTRRTGFLLVAVALCQAAFWLGATHLQSRFALPLLATGCLGVGLLLAVARRPVAITLLTALLVGWLTFSAYQGYARQNEGLASAFIDGIDVIAEVHPEWGLINDLPTGSRIYAEGFARPLYVRHEIDYHTVWDRSALGRLIEVHGVAEALAKLRERGFTHLLIHRGMIGRWMGPDNYGYDPNITIHRLELIDKAGLGIVTPNPGFMTVYRLGVMR